MKKLSASVLCLLSSVLRASFLFALASCPLFASAQAPQLINYQGRLLNGTNLVNGNVGLSLRLFNVSSGGASIYEDSNTVTVADGLYSTFIGDNPTNAAFLSALTNAGVWIEVEVNGVALSPRERLVSAAYAVRSQHAQVFTGSVSDSQLSANIARLNGTNQTFTGQVNFSSVSNTFTGSFAGNGTGVTNVNLSSVIIVQQPVIAWGYGFYGQTNVPATATNVVAIAGGENHSLALRADGRVIAWGFSSSGQTNVPATATGVVAIAGGSQSLALRSDGTVIAWGYNGFGQTNVPASATGVVAIACGRYHSLALRGNGTVIAWGAGTNDLNDGDIEGQCIVPSSATGVVAIAGGFAHSLALRSDGTVIAWGAGTNDLNDSVNEGQCIVPSSATGVVAIAAGGLHSLALRSDGTVITWGYQGVGLTNVPATATGVVAIAGGGRHSLALRGNGTVIAWGFNGIGQSTVPASASGVVAIAAGDLHSLALRGDWVSAPIARLDAAASIFAGTVSATAFSGDGSGLTGVTAAAFAPQLATNFALLSGTNTFSGTNFFSGTFLGSPPYIMLAETQVVGVAAGANVAGTNNFRNLNAKLADTHNLASIANGDVTLPAGTYYCRIRAPAYRVDENQTRLRTSTGTVLLYGTSTYSDNTLSPSVQTYSVIEGQFTLGTTSTLQVQHYTKTVRSPNGLGVPASATWGDGAPYELYTVAEFWKIK